VRAQDYLKNPRQCRVIATYVTLAAMLLFANPALAQTAFDGVWDARATTDSGPCRATQQHLLRIRNGRALDADARLYKVNGGLEASGRINGTVRVRRTTLLVTGKINGSAASGSWKSTGSKTCAGRWEAERRD
jgi:hypothetical protein